MKKLALLAWALTACVTKPSVVEKSIAPKPLIIGHRGLPGHWPEHTIEGYTHAIEAGADYIEPDLVSTKDGVLVVRHENEISGTTDAAEKFPRRKTTKTVDGKAITGWFVEDFTLAELKTLRAKERLATRSQANNGRFPVPTFEEVIALAQARGVGIYPETKHPSYFRGIGLALEPKLVRALNAHGLNQEGAKVFVQSFEPSSLRELRPQLRVPFIQLIDEENVRPYDFVLARDPRTYGDLLKDPGLAEIATYAQGIGPWKDSIVHGDHVSDLVTRAHRHGLLVHPYTFRSDPEFLPARYRGSAEAEYNEFFDLGVDGVFSDFADQAVPARTRWLGFRR